MKSLNNNNKVSSARVNVTGFTLIELLVIMAILTSLMAIGYGVFSKSTSKAKENETLAILEAVSEAMTARSNDISSAQRAAMGISNGMFPAGDGTDGSTEGLVFYISGDFNSDGSIDTGAKSKNSKIIPGESGNDTFLDTDGRIVDAWNNPIRYKFPGEYHNEDNGFDLESAGPDREFGADADDDLAKDNIILK